MVRTMKKVRFDELVTILNVTEVVEQASSSDFEPNFNHECHEEEEEEEEVAVTIQNDLSNELSHLSVLPIVGEWQEEEEIHLRVLPTVELTELNNVSNYSNAFFGSNYDYRSRWMMSNNEMNDEPPILPLRENKQEPMNTIISAALSIVEDWPQATVPPSDDNTAITARAD